MAKTATERATYSRNYYQNRKARMAQDRAAERAAEEAAIIALETDEEVDERLRTRFNTLEELCDAAIHNNHCRALIVSGPAGLGKSYTVEAAMANWDPDERKHEIVKGYVRTTGLFRLLWNYRHRDNVIVFDDADTVFLDDVSLNMLKTACDTTERRRISYRAEVAMEDEDGSVIPRSFEFEGTVIFITNHDFDDAIERELKLAPHFQALVSRSHYIDLGMKTRRDYLVRMKQVVRDGLLRDYNDEIQADVMHFIDENHPHLRELSLRIVLKLASLREMGREKFEDLAKVTCCKGIA